MKNIRWIIQNNLIAENDLNEIQNACKDMGVEFEEILVIPFSSELPEFIKDDKTNIYYGSTTLMYNVYKHLNKPEGLFFNEESFSIENYIKVWKDYMLNSEARTLAFKDFVLENNADDSLWFIRPDADDKSFNGETKTFKDIKDFLEGVIKSNKFMADEGLIPPDICVTGDTMVMVGPPYNIKKEWRNYIVDGKVVASSLYRKNFRLNKSRHDVPEDMIKFVEDRCKEYMPHKIFAMDIALCGDGYYIIECGCLNSVGFYDADIPKIVRSVTEYISKN